MFFLKGVHHLIQKSHLLFKNNKIEFPLQVRKHIHSGKAFFSASQRVKGGLTVEAAFVMPIIIFIVAAFSYLMMVMCLQIKLQEALDTAGRRLAGYAYIYEQIGEVAFETEEEAIQEEPGIRELVEYGLNSAYAWKLVRDYAGEDWLDHFFIQNGKNGVWIAGGDMLSEDGVIDLVLHYTVKLPYLPGESIGLPMVSRCRIKAWIGFEKKGKEAKEETDEEIVYITETGSVYHTNRNCTHLKLSVKEVAFYNIENMRNQSGGKFYACERCLHKNESSLVTGFEKVYITKTGDSYHCDKECSGLKRTISEVMISQVGERDKCKRCMQSGW